MKSCKNGRVELFRRKLGSVDGAVGTRVITFHGLAEYTTQFQEGRRACISKKRPMTGERTMLGQVKLEISG